MTAPTPLYSFMRESLRIEGIHRPATQDELDATAAFLAGDRLVGNVLALQAVYAPGMPLRDKPGMNVRVGTHIAPLGSDGMRKLLAAVLRITDPWTAHVEFEKLHPFMDGNGRTGRTLWAQVMLWDHQDPFALPFLHRFYYQTLARNDEH